MIKIIGDVEKNHFPFLKTEINIGNEGKCNRTPFSPRVKMTEMYGLFYLHFC